MHSGAVVTGGARAASAPAHGTARVSSGTSGVRVAAGAPRGGGIRTTHRHGGTSFGFNGNSGGTDLQNVPGLGFDYPHLAAVSGNRRIRNGRFGGGGFPFGFSGFLLSPPVIVEEAPGPESQDVVEEDAPQNSVEAPRVRHSRPARVIAEAEPLGPPAPVPDAPEYVFVRRDGGLVFAVAYSWDQGTLRYVTREGLRRSIAGDTLDLDATHQFNEQRGVSFRSGS
jgi:hypothetical protein